MKSESSMLDNRDLDRVYLAIGKFQVNWSVFEYELYRFTKIIYANCPTFIPAKFPDGIAGKIALLKRVLKKEPRLSGISADGLKLTKALWLHLKLRHLIVHGSIAHIENSSTLTFFRPLEIGDGPLKRAERVQVELSQIEMEAQEMEYRSLELGFFGSQFEDAFPIPPGSHSP